LIACFLVLFDNLKRKIADQPRGGPLRREDGAINHAIPSALLPLLLVGPWRCW
jgi:hypothetical protein